MHSNSSLTLGTFVSYTEQHQFKLRKPTVLFRSVLITKLTSMQSSKIIISHYPLKNTMLNDILCFAKLDLAEAYLQVEVTQLSRKLNMINTHHMLFQCIKLPFGAKSALSTFEQIMDTILLNLKRPSVYRNYIIIVWSSHKVIK